MAEHNLAPTRVATVGFGFLTLNSGLAIYRAKGDTGSTFFVLGSYLTLLLLLGYLRGYERARRAVWPLTTLPLITARGVLCTGADEHHLERQVAALIMAAFAATACDSALAVHDARGDVASAAAVLVAYAALLALTFRFLRAFGAH
jgi:alpha-D-ribose 1-methylphosphonate 5-triphosphate synthase subunit PhnI